MVLNEHSGELIFLTKTINGLVKFTFMLHSREKVRVIGASRKNKRHTNLPILFVIKYEPQFANK